jgi:arginyl-tRNA--protein-N-Asp/Glu arginylyltransferase
MNQGKPNHKGESTNIETLTVTRELREDPEFCSHWAKFISADNLKQEFEAFKEMKRIVEKKKEEKKKSTPKAARPNS